MTSQTEQLLVLAALWLTYCLVHSTLASLTTKRWVAAHRPHWMPGYRLFFNLVAVVLLIPPLGLTLLYRGAPLWQWSGPFGWLANGLTLAALAGFVWSLRWYDTREFLGLRQWRLGLRSVEDQERFHISPAHRFVRHPWYFLGLVLIWSRDMNGAFLTSALAMTLYFLLGSYLEERKLMVYHGAVYRRYRARVPGLIPLPWHRLSRAEAERLQREDVSE